ncbi:MAG: hypothetical protein NZM15_04420 [Flavobacteriales bacterium]|nr:hypothetical protein [Flavobacteriales bacterium]MDW8431930.1 hypothetical protein [Flavobacteriales bacterium]
MAQDRPSRVLFLLAFSGALLGSCNQVIEVHFEIENPQPVSLQVMYYSQKSYDSVGYVLKPGEVWPLDGRRVPLPRKLQAAPSFERDKRFTFGRIWNDSLKLKKNINNENFWTLSNPAPDRYVYRLRLDTAVLGIW